MYLLFSALFADLFLTFSFMVGLSESGAKSVSSIHEHARQLYVAVHYLQL